MNDIDYSAIVQYCNEMELICLRGVSHTFDVIIECQLKRHHQQLCDKYQRLRDDIIHMRRGFLRARASNNKSKSDDEVLHRMTSLICYSDDQPGAVNAIEKLVMEAGAMLPLDAGWGSPGEMIIRTVLQKIHHPLYNQPMQDMKQDMQDLVKCIQLLMISCPIIVNYNTEYIDMQHRTLFDILRQCLWDPRRYIDDDWPLRSIEGDPVWTGGDINVDCVDAAFRVLIFVILLCQVIMNETLDVPRVDIMNALRNAMCIINWPFSPRYPLSNSYIRTQHRQVTRLLLNLYDTIPTQKIDAVVNQSEELPEYYRSFSARREEDFYKYDTTLLFDSNNGRIKSVSLNFLFRCECNSIRVLLFSYLKFDKHYSFIGLLEDERSEFIKLLQISSIRKLLLQFTTLFFDLVRKNEIDVLRWIWSEEKDIMLSYVDDKSNSDLIFACLHNGICFGPTIDFLLGCGFDQTLNE